MADFPHTRSFAWQTSAAVRGPAHLRQDIADEIADHLACHAEGDTQDDPTVAQSTAIQAFGDPKQVARELRRIHLGDQIMFQRVMIAVLVVAIGAMALTGYLSWSANRESARQFAEMNKNLASLVDAQRAAVPPKPEPRAAALTPPPRPVPLAEKKGRLKVFCCTLPDLAPVPNQDISISSSSFGPTPVPRMASSFSAQYRTGPDGCATTEPLPLGYYDVHTTLPPSGDGAAFEPAMCGGLAQVDQPDQITEFRLPLGSNLTHEVRIDVPAEISWDREALSATFISVSTRAPSGKDGAPGVWLTRNYPIQLYGVNRISGLLPGKAEVALMLGNTTMTGTNPFEETNKASGQNWASLLGLAEIDIPAKEGPIAVPFELTPKDRMMGLIYAGSREHPLANARIEVLILQVMSGSRGDGPPYRVRRDVLRTDAEGRFTAFARPPGMAKTPTTFDIIPGPPFQLPPGTPEFTPRSGPPVPSSEFDRLPGWAIAIPWHTVDGHPATLHWPLASESLCQPIKLFQVASGETRYECDLALLGTLRIAFTGLDKLAAAGREVHGQVEVSWQQPGPHVPGLGSLWRRKLALPGDKEAEAVLFPGNYQVNVKLPLIERDAQTPELERHTLYSRDTKLFVANVRPGERCDVTVALDDLKDWYAKQSEWHRRGGGPVATAPATQPAEAR